MVTNTNANSLCDESTDHGEPITRPLIDLLLLALIDAYPNYETPSEQRLAINREQRLAEARKALFGEIHTAGTRVMNDDKAMRWMAAEFQKDQYWLTTNSFHRIARTDVGRLKRKVRSVRALAIAAAHKFYPNRNDDVSERIRKKFYRTKRKWLDIDHYHDDVPDTLDYEALKRFSETLNARGVRTKLP